MYAQCMRGPCLQFQGTQFGRYNLILSMSCFRYQSGDQTPATEAAGPTEGAKVPPGDLDVKSQILQQQELQKQASAAAKSKGSSAPTSPMKDGKRASFFGKVIQEMNQMYNG